MCPSGLVKANRHKGRIWHNQEIGVLPIALLCKFGHETSLAIFHMGPFRRRHTHNGSCMDGRAVSGFPKVRKETERDDGSVNTDLQTGFNSSELTRSGVGDQGVNSLVIHHQDLLLLLLLFLIILILRRTDWLDRCLAWRMLYNRIRLLSARSGLSSRRAVDSSRLPLKTCPPLDESPSDKFGNCHKTRSLSVVSGNCEIWGHSPY